MSGYIIVIFFGMVFGFYKIYLNMAKKFIVFVQKERHV